MADQLLGQFSSGMDRRTRRGGKNGPQQLWSLINGYINAKKDVVPRPGLQHVADVPNSAGLYGFDGQLHIFHSGDEGFIDPVNALIAPHIVRYPLLITGSTPPVLDAYGLELMKDDPLIYTPCTETGGTVANDLSGHGFNGVYTGAYLHDETALRTGGRSVKVGMAEFTAGFISIPDGDYSSVFATDQWTVEAIFLYAGQRGLSGNYICSKMANVAFGLGTFNMFVATPTPFPVTVKTSGSISGQEVGIESVVDLDEPHIVAMVKDGIDFSMYVDGVFVQTIPGANFISFNNSAPICIGGNNLETIAYQFFGNISDFALYPAALTADRLLAHAVAGGLA